MNANSDSMKRQWHEQMCRKTVENLKQRSFDAVYCASSNDASGFILKAAAQAKTIGIGGSMSVVELNINDKLLGIGAKLLVKGNPHLEPEEREQFMRLQQTCDLFLSSVNALTVGGELVNIDSVGNRASACVFGPGKIIIVAGRNKIVDGDVGDAIKRIKKKAAPPNNVRLNKDTPCVKTGECADCNSPDRICRVTVIMDRKPMRSDITVLVVNEDLGF